MSERAISVGLEEILGQQFPVLDHGFIRVVDYMGNDGSVVQAARVSYGQGTKTARRDEGLIAYLMSHDHNTPFEMCEIKFHVRLPIFVARQWIRHRTANVNEYSARYSVIPDEFYLPDVEHINTQSADNKQGRGDPLPEEQSGKIRDALKKVSEECYSRYKEMIDANVARELARTVLPVNFYTEWYWKIDAHNLMRFLRLRTDKHAQYEIRMYADIMLDIFKLWMPITYGAFMKYQINGARLSDDEITVIRQMLKGDAVSPNLPERRAGELAKLLDIEEVD